MDYMIPTIFNEETEFLSDSNLNMNSLKFNYMTFYWRICRDFLDYIEDQMSHENFIAEHMIPTKFYEATESLSDSNLNSLKRHYMTFYWNVRKDYLDYIENSMPHDSLIRSTINTRPKKGVLPQVFFHMILKHLRYQRKTTNMIYTLRISIIHFYSNLTLRDTGTTLRRNPRKIRII
jgi:uncharacterized membrane protein YpjA